MIWTTLSQSYVGYRMEMPGYDRTHSGSLEIKIEDCWNIVIRSDMH